MLRVWSRGEVPCKMVSQEEVAHAWLVHCMGFVTISASRLEGWLMKCIAGGSKSQHCSIICYAAKKVICCVAMKEKHHSVEPQVCILDAMVL